MSDTLNDRLRAEIVDLNDALWSCREALVSLVEVHYPDGAPNGILMAMENARRLLDAPGRCAQETARLRDEVERYEAFVAAYDAWANNKPGDLEPGGMTDLFDEMQRARAAIPAAADPATEGV